MQNIIVSIERKETGIHMLFSVLFVLIAEVIHTILVPLSFPWPLP